MQPPFIIRGSLLVQNRLQAKSCLCLRRVGCYGRLHVTIHHRREISSSLFAWANGGGFVALLFRFGRYLAVDYVRSLLGRSSRSQGRIFSSETAHHVWRLLYQDTPPHIPRHRCSCATAQTQQDFHSDQRHRSPNGVNSQSLRIAYCFLPRSCARSQASFLWQ